MTLKLSQITSGSTIIPSSDQVVAVRGGSADVLVNVGTAAPLNASNAALANLASVSGTITTGHVATFADAAGTVQDGGAIGTAAAQAASSVTGTVAAVSGSVTVGHLAVFSNTAGTIVDGGSVPSSYTLPTASTSVLGGVKIDGTTISISGGVISATGSAVVPYVASSGTASAAGSNALAAGPTSNASGNNGTALGNSAAATATSATAVGSSATAAGIGATAIGVSATATNNFSTALGYSATVSSATDATAVGANCTANHNSSVALGYGVTTSAVNDIVIGNGVWSISVAGGSGNLTIPTGGTLLTTIASLSNGAASAAGTLTNAPAAGNPTKWIPISDNGVTRYIPAW
jgi:hypothetical protein